MPSPRGDITPFLVHILSCNHNSVIVNTFKISALHLTPCTVSILISFISLKTVNYLVRPNCKTLVLNSGFYFSVCEISYSIL